MNDLFGLSMTWIALGCVIVTGGILVFMAFIAVRNPVMFKNGLRNIPRRPSQTALIIVGLMLSTLIITAAFGTGDTMTHSVTGEVYNILGPTDEIIQWDTKKNPAPEDKQVIPLTTVEQWQQHFANDPDIKAMFPILGEFMPVQDGRTRLNESNAHVIATRPQDVASFGGLKDVNGNPVTLGPGDIAVNKELEDKIDAKVGDTISIFYKGQPTKLTVKAIVPNSLLGGTNDPTNKAGGAVNYDFFSTLLGKQGEANAVAVSNTGGVHSGLGQTSTVTAKLDTVLQGTPYKVNEIKHDLVNFAELLGNIFTSLFVVFGLFSIAAGILLIFLIFVMLAAERKPEMGMARAVGAKRRQIVESFLAEGMGYDLGAALVGLVAGVGVAAAMMTFVKLSLGDQLGLNLEFSVAARSLIVSFCLGVIVTFIVVFFASWRASRLNIVAAIRDLPETRPHNAEDATWRGYFRGALNGFTAFGILVFSVFAAIHFTNFAPLFLLAALLGLAGPWIAMLRGRNFGASKVERKEGERLPTWPLILGGVLLLAAGLGLLILIGYGLAILVVRLTRDRKPNSIPVWLMIVGIVVAPIGLVLTAMQSRGRQVAWSVGVGVVCLAIGLLLLQWGVQSGQMGAFALGFSLIAFWAAATLRYFRIQERLTFTVTSLVLLAFWYLLPGGRLDAITGSLNGGPEMFFFSGAVMVISGTFIVVYNADIILPAIARLGSGFGRIAPAVKTAVAYPLTSRFRTGLTIAMIGLIMFVLSMQAALNTNFEKAFIGGNAKGGFDVVVNVNGNNRANNSQDFVADLQKSNQDKSIPGNVDTSKITSIGEARVADATEVDIADPAWAKKDPSKRNPDDQYKHYEMMGVEQGFINAQQIQLKYRAAGYTDDKAVWDALAKNPNYAIIPSSLTSGGGFGNGPAGDDLLSLNSDVTKDSFKPFTLTIRDRSTGKMTDITVIGQAKDAAGTFWPGIIVGKQMVLQTFPQSKGQTFFLSLQSGVNAQAYAKSVEAHLVQASADSSQKIIDDGQAQNRTFLNMFQGFLALGLLVGIAALGVIAFRAVVERRQQIGMLRAIGYQRSMVQLSFLLESGFIALSGIILGLGLGLTFAWNLFSSGEFGDTSAGISFTVPWLQVGLATAFALIASMIMTWLPARAASRIAVAEALRYE